ncbi:MAG: PilZ domain-containing protein [Sphingomonadaceae bacterium]
MAQDEEPSSPGPQISFSGEVPSPDRRSEPRQISILRVGKIFAGGRQALCRIRNISSRGLMAESPLPHAPGDEVKLELQSMAPIPGEIIWSRDRYIGVRFDEPVDLDRVLASRTPEGLPVRPPRIELAARARLRCGADYFQAPLLNLSQGGARVECDCPQCIGRGIVMTVDGLGTIEGTVRWVEDGYAGIAFNERLGFDRLTAWLVARMEASGGEAA